MGDEVYILWVDPEEEYCSNCGTRLSRHERFLCYDCQQDEWCTEDEDFYVGWLGEGE